MWCEINIKIEEKDKNEIEKYHMIEFFIWMMQVLIINSYNSLSVTNLNMINSPKSHIHVNGREGATFSHINISAPGDSPNTDVFDISTSKNIMIEDSTIAEKKKKKFIYILNGTRLEERQRAIANDGESV